VPSENASTANPDGAAKTGAAHNNNTNNNKDFFIPLISFLVIKIKRWGF
jgi:hypothetical protein